MTQLLDIRNLSIDFPMRGLVLNAVKGFNLQVNAGEIIGLVGESGAGKSTVGNAITGLLGKPGRISRGEVIFQGENICDYTDEQMRKLRGRRIGMIFQDPQSSLNPLMTVGKQLVETIQECLGLRLKEAEARAIELLNDVGIPDPESRLKSYPHQFSGGMRQRVVIALALAGDPELIIADEPTTALDVSIQSQILQLIRKICDERGVGVIMVTHDIGVVSEIADRVAVMFRGELVEVGGVDQVLRNPQHEYTQNLIVAVPSPDKRLHRFTCVDLIEGEASQTKIDVQTHWLGKANSDVVEDAGPAIEIKDMSLAFRLKNSVLKSQRTFVQAVDNVSFDIEQGETFGLVGESGSGKSTLARIVAGLHTADKGELSIYGKKIGFKHNDPARRHSRTFLQVVFQDPYSSMNSRMNIRDIVAEPMRFHNLTENEAQTRQIVDDLLDHVGLGKTAARRYPHEFSGGQRQRIAIARALASRPKILICDEPTSALDVSTQAQILNLLRDLQDELGLTMLFISHDLPVVRQMCDRIAVMRHGKICEIASNEDLFENPQHEYSQHLLKLMPNLGAS
ncbi:ABC transporter ATP-binding protein [Pacificibacter sp. AS14]|uniref:ABC transporter ATP-binding protein n=1 Tax=Pacificibacter sp. AS14 TaxID=3135785 RepID=UPI00317095F8